MVQGLSVTADGVGVVAHAGSIATRLLADRVGLTAEPVQGDGLPRLHPWAWISRVLADVAVVLTDGGEAIADIEVLRHQAAVLVRSRRPDGLGAGTPDEVGPGRLKKIGKARASAQERVGTAARRPATLQGPGTDLGEVVVLDAPGCHGRGHP